MFFHSTSCMSCNLPTLLTWLRVCLIPLIVSIYRLPENWLDPFEVDMIATSIFVVAALTDWADGYLARRWHQTSSFGAFLDPVADKLMVTAALLILLNLGRADHIVVFVIISREITISALREWMAQIGTSRKVAVNWIGKIKTATQMSAITVLLLPTPIFGEYSFIWFGQKLLLLAAALTLWSMFYYLYVALSADRTNS